MKIYNQVVIDINSGKVLSEDSFEYSGPVSLAWGGDGNEGGRGASSDSDGSESDTESSSNDSGGGSNGGENGGDQGGGDANSDGRPGGGDTSGMGADSSYGGAGGDSGMSGGDGVSLRDIGDVAISLGNMFSLGGVALGNPGLAAAGTFGKMAGHGLNALDTAIDKLSDVDFSGMFDSSGSPAGGNTAAAESNGAEGNISPNAAMAGIPGMPGTSAANPAQTAANPLPSINDQFYSMYQGQDAPYGIADQMKGYTGVQGKTVSDWDAFEEKYNQAGASVTDAYDVLQKQHMDTLNKIPQATVTLPKHMGGANMPLVPGKWVNTINAAADTQKDILDSKAKAIPAFAGIQGSAIAGRNQAGSNQYLTPMNTAFDIFKGDKGYANQQSMLDKQLDANEPDTWDRILSGVMAGSKIYSDNSDSIDKGLSDLWDWISGG